MSLSNYELKSNDPKHLFDLAQTALSRFKAVLARKYSGLNPKIAHGNLCLDAQVFDKKERIWVEEFDSMFEIDFPDSNTIGFIFDFNLVNKLLETQKTDRIRFTLYSDIRMERDETSQEFSQRMEQAKINKQEAQQTRVRSVLEHIAKLSEEDRKLVKIYLETGEKITSRLQNSK